MLNFPPFALSLSKGCDASTELHREQMKTPAIVKHDKAKVALLQGLTDGCKIVGATLAVAYSEWGSRKGMPLQ